MKKLITNTIAVVMVCTTAAFSQSHSIKTSSDSTVKNQNNVPAATKGVEKADKTDGIATKNQNNAVQSERATNADKNVNTNKEAKVSHGGHAAQGQPSSTHKASKQPAGSRMNADRKNTDTSNVNKSEFKPQGVRKND